MSRPWRGSRVERDGHLVLLAEVAQVGAELQPHRVWRGSRPRPARPAPLVGHLGRTAGRPRPSRARRVAPSALRTRSRRTGVTSVAESREHAGLRREDHRRALQQLADRAGVHRAGAAEGEQRQAAMVDAAIGGVGAGRARPSSRRRCDRCPPAACAGVTFPAPSPSRSIAASAAGLSSGMSPPRKLSASSRPSTRSASVTVGSAPPRP